MGNVVLGLLFLAPCTLYSLKKQFEGGISLFYSASLGSIGTALVVLTERGHVVVSESVENGRSKKTFSVTERGRSAFLAWMREPITQRDFETIALSRLFFLGLLPKPDRSEVLARIHERQQADEAALRELALQLDAMEVPAEHREVFRYQRQVLEYGLLSYRAVGDFFREVDSTA